MYAVCAPAWGAGLLPGGGGVSDKYLFHAIAEPSKMKIPRKQLEGLVRMGLMQKPREKTPTLLPVRAACAFFKLLKARPEEVCFAS